MKKHLVLALVVFVAASILLMANFASAQSIPKPAAPQFSIQEVDRSYYVPSTTTTDPYSGQQTTHPGYTVANLRIEGEIKNQPFTPYIMPDPNSTSTPPLNLNIDFYYEIYSKGHFGDDWRPLIVGEYPLNYLKQEYDQDYTNFTVDFGGGITLREGDQIDFQVRAVIGYRATHFTQTWVYRVIDGELSDWSQTLTITYLADTTNSSTHASNIDSSAYPTLVVQQASPTATISPTPTIPEFPAIAIIILLFAVITPIVAAKKFVLKEGRKT